MTAADPYHHTQRAPLSVGLLLIAFLMVAIGLGLHAEVPVVPYVLFTAAAIFVLLALCFYQLTVADAGDHLAVRFGPLPVFGTRVPYDAIRGLEAGRSAWIDGLGIHRIPGRGWTYNLWGRSCVLIRQDSGLVRIGSDDAPGLLAFLRRKTGVEAAATS